MDSKIKIPAMVALVVLVALAFWYLRGMPDAPATEVDETTKASEDQDRGGTAAFTPNTETPPDARPGGRSRGHSHLTVVVFGDRHLMMGVRRNLGQVGHHQHLAA